MIFFLSSRLMILFYKHILLSKWEIPWSWLLSVLFLSRSLLVRRLSWDCARLLWVPNINSVAYTQNGRHMGYVRLYWTKELMKNHILRDATTEPPSIQTESIFQQISTCFFFSRSFVLSCVLTGKHFICFPIELQLLDGFTKKRKHLELSTRNSEPVPAQFFLHFIEICAAFDEIIIISCSFNLIFMCCWQRLKFFAASQQRIFTRNAMMYHNWTVHKSLISIH